MPKTFQFWAIKLNVQVNKPPAKAGGFKLRLKAGFYRPNGSITALGNHHLVHRAFVLQYIFSTRHLLHFRLTQPNNHAPTDAVSNIAFPTPETLITIYACFYPSEIAQPLTPISVAAFQLADGRDSGCLIPHMPSFLGCMPFFAGALDILVQHSPLTPYNDIAEAK
jgi:hypothetical protein